MLVGRGAGVRGWGELEPESQNLKSTDRAMEEGGLVRGSRKNRTTSGRLELWSLGILPSPNTSHKEEQLPSTGRWTHPSPASLPALQSLASQGRPREEIPQLALSAKMQCHL